MSESKNYLKIINEKENVVTYDVYAKRHSKPLFSNNQHVYIRTEKKSTHSQKIMMMFFRCVERIHTAIA